MAEPLALGAGPFRPSGGTRHVLTDVEFDLLWDELRLGPTPVVLRLRSPGRTRAERARVAAEGLRGLRERGLAGPSGPDPDLVRLLGLLAAPQRQLELRAWFGYPVRADAAERDGDGVLALRRDRTVVLSAGGSPAHAVVSALPVLVAGPGPAVTLPTATLAAMLTDTPCGDVVTALTELGTDPHDAAVLGRVLRGPAHRGQVTAVVYDRWGGPHRPVPHVTLLDSPGGRYRLTRRAGADGTEWSTVAPVDPRGLHALLAELLDTAAEQLDTPR